jgi:hypothetical protein
MFITDYMSNKKCEGQCITAMEKDALTIFQSWKGFKDRITRVFSDINHERTAERYIWNLRQQDCATSYTAEFQQYSEKKRTGMTLLLMPSNYYRGLNDMVKDEIARSDRPITLQDMITLAIKIGNRNFEQDPQ